MTEDMGAGADDDATEVVPAVPDPAVSGDEHGDDGGSTGSRRKWLLGALAALIVLAGALVAVAAGGDDDDDVVTEEEGSTTSSSSSSTSSSSSSTSTSVVETTTTAPVDDELEAPGEPPAQRKCVDAGGGPAEPTYDTWASNWTTKPEPNDPVTMRLCISDITPVMGQTVQVTLIADDPDAVITEANCGYIVDFESDGMGNLCRDAIIPHDGPRPTPPEQPGHIEVTFNHTYTRNGTFLLSASVISAEWAGYRTPYSSYAEASFDVVVHPVLVVD